MAGQVPGVWCTQALLDVGQHQQELREQEQAGRVQGAAFGMRPATQLTDTAAISHHPSVSMLTGDLLTKVGRE